MSPADPPEDEKSITPPKTSGWTERLALNETESAGVRSEHSFTKALEQLLLTHRNWWVAFHDDKQIGLERSRTALAKKCIRYCQEQGIESFDLAFHRVTEESSMFHGLE
jgi:hypothetical protein